MAMFTFYLCQADGHASSFESFEMGDDPDLAARALQLLADHPGCAYVNVWRGDEKLISVHREASSRRGASARAGSGSD